MDEEGELKGERNGREGRWRGRQKEKMEDEGQLRGERNGREGRWRGRRKEKMEDEGQLRGERKEEGWKTISDLGKTK